MRKYIPAILIILLLLVGVILVCLFFGKEKTSKEKTPSQASFSIRFPDQTQLELKSQTFTISFSKTSFGFTPPEDEKVIFTIFGVQSKKTKKEDIEADIIAQELETNAQKGVVLISFKKPDPNLREIICDLGIDNICEVVFDRSYIDYLSRIENFVVNQGKLEISLDKDQIKGTLSHAKTKEGVEIEGSFKFLLDEDIAGSSWSENQLAQVREQIPLERVQHKLKFEERNEKRVSDLHLLQLALILYFEDHQAYPITKEPLYLKGENLKDHPLFITLTSDPKYGIPKETFPLDPAKDQFYQYQSDGKTYLLTAILEGISDPIKNERCNQELSKEKCIYGVTPTF